MGSKQGTTSWKTSVAEFKKIGGNPTSYSLNGNKANARIGVEQDVDLVLRNMKLLGQPQDELLITKDSRYKHYKAMKTAYFLLMAYRKLYR